MTLPTLTTASEGGRLLLASESAATADTDARTITGVVVPYGKVGATSTGRLTFSRGSLQISDPKRVKLLREHDQAGHVLGHGLSFEDTDAGLVGTFAVARTPAGDQALLEASQGLRDGLSVGVQLDDRTLTHLRRANGASVAGSGQLREVSTVSVPAFDDARLAASADLFVSSWTDAGSSSTTTTTTTESGATMPEQTPTPAPPTNPEQPTPAPPTNPAQPTPAPAQPAPGETTTASQAGVVTAVAGAAHVTAEPATYDFATGHSLVRDLYAGAMLRDSEAATRVERFNAELRQGNPASVLTLAAATRDNVDGAGTDLPSMFQPAPNRPDLIRQAADVRRPFIARLTRVPISNAQPFAIPKVGEFTGVGDHTEGTPHRPAGTLTLGGDTVQPTATSGAWEASRELLDAATPALDRIAARAMMRDYSRQTEGKVVSLVAARAAQEGSTVYGIDTPLAMRGAMLDFVNDDEEGADLVALSKGLLRTFGLDTDNDDRPQLPFIGAVNAVGTIRAGYTGLTIDGVEMFRAARLDSRAGLGADVGVLARSEGILWAESNVLQFRFDEVLGPGVIKLALWAYTGAALLDTADVQIVRSTPAP